MQDLDLLKCTSQSGHEETDDEEALAECLRLLGEASRGKDLLTDALTFFDEAVARAPKMALMFISRGRCHLDMELKGMRPLDSPAKQSKKERVSPLQPT
jgi:hypothetical protein